MLYKRGFSNKNLHIILNFSIKLEILTYWFKVCLTVKLQQW